MTVDRNLMMPSRTKPIDGSSREGLMKKKNEVDHWWMS
jgi:hypothetical protein